MTDHQREAVERVEREMNAILEAHPDCSGMGVLVDDLKAILNLAKQTSEEPTEAMIEAGVKVLSPHGGARDYCRDLTRSVYLAMRSQQSGNSHE